MNNKNEKDLKQPIQLLELEDFSTSDTANSGMICDIETGICTVPEADNHSSTKSEDKSAKQD